MSFTTDLKKEIIAKGIEREGRAAAISAFLRTSGNVGLRGDLPAFYFVSETENVAEFFMSAFFEEFGVELVVSHAMQDRMSGRDKLVIECPEEKMPSVAKALGLLKKTGDLREDISSSLLSTEIKKIAYIRGAFLGGGSCTVPAESGKTGYHLEFVFPAKRIAQDFCDLLAEFELVGKLAERKESFVVYVKSKELISDFLSVVGAEGCLRRFTSLMEKRDKANNENRARNCIAGNADKTAIAAVKQVVALQRLKNGVGYTQLSEELRALANARLANPTMSLQELANRLGVSKSCLNHRMRKLMEIAKETEE